MPIRWLAFLVALALPAAAQVPLDLAQSAQSQLPALTAIYKHLHENPELSKHEQQTSAFLAAHLRALGYTVTEHVGKYADGSQAYGVVAILENGPGPRLMIRTDMDALRSWKKPASLSRATSPNPAPTASLFPWRTPADTTCT